MDGAHHLHYRLAFMHHSLCAVLADDGQLALNQSAAVHHWVVVPTQLLAGGNLVFYGHHLGAALRVVGQLHSVPAPVGAYQFGGLQQLVVVVARVQPMFFQTLIIVFDDAGGGAGGVFVAFAGPFRPVALLVHFGIGESLDRLIAVVRVFYFDHKSAFVVGI